MSLNILWYGVEPMFWYKLIILILFVILLIIVFRVVIRTILRLEKGELNAYDFINGNHKKIHRIITSVTILWLILGYMINIQKDYMDELLLFKPGYILMISTGLLGLTRVYMEWKYVENKKLYVFTLSQLVFYIILFVSIIMTNFFGWF
ncbi:DUF4181 domain-containing protein [Halalkalibacter okhensis]|uniref:DUF4181 domain-containing protein n=1 Tax=Halalkalibacter okhensis TaxID=333138 RepID=A0A0B0IIZ7_9BACI|nr:DUF4181 domain-containing protein [Halalkalibacter okhensis]KHF39646.1 hypothetical protein LQ50_13510 [Halalkalibacter okhensis]